MPNKFGPFVFGQGFLAPFLRGQGFLQQGKSTEAVKEFQKILDKRAAAPFAPLQALARLGLARAYSLGGEIEKARTAY